MVEFDLVEVKNNAISFKEYHTYVFIQTKNQYYNGYICQVDELIFMFMDDKIPAPFPIRWDSLIAPIVPSKREVGK